MKNLLLLLLGIAIWATSIVQSLISHFPLNLIPSFIGGLIVGWNIGPIIDSVKKMFDKSQD